MYTVSKKGFTLVELIVVITILAILGTVAFLSLSSYTTLARNAIRLDGVSKIATSIEAKKQAGISVLSFVSPGQEVPSAQIGGRAVTPGSDYQAGEINPTALEVKSEDFSDPTSGKLFSMGATTRIGGQYEIVATIEEGTTERAILSGTYEPRDSEIITGIGILSEDTFVLADLTDLNKLKKGDVITGVGVPSGTSISSVSSDGLTFTLNNIFTADSNAIQLASSETSGMVVSVDGVTPVTAGSSNIPYRVISTPPPAFITTWKTDNAGASNSNQITLPLDISGNYNFSVDWGDGSSDIITSYNQPEVIHTYATAGEYTVTIEGTLTGFSFGFGTTDAWKLIDVSQWGIVKLANTGAQFYGARGLHITASDNLDLSNVTNASNMFYLARLQDADISGWDTRSFTETWSMFQSANLTDADVSGWDLSNVTNMFRMFRYANVTNLDVSNFDLRGEERSMGDMFRNTRGIMSGNIGTWDTTDVTNMSGMFAQATSFNQDIGGWNIEKVFSTNQMFERAYSFNQDIGGWDPQSLYSASSMFAQATSFNQDIGGWNTEVLRSMANMFNGATAFDQDISGWNVVDIRSITSYDANTSASWEDEEKPNFE